MRKITIRPAGIIMTAFIAAAVLTACSGGVSSEPAADDEQKDIISDMPVIDTDDADIDLDALNESVESLKNLDLDTDVSIDTPADEEDLSAETSDEPEGDKTVYSFTDVYRNGNDITVIPNGGLNGSTVLYGDKDLKGFLDYVDSTVLEKGRTINREFFFDMLAVMLVDKDLSSDIDSIEKNMIMSLAMANNFHDADVTIKDCHLDADNAAEYHYDVIAFGKDDTWIVNYGNRTVYMNNGATEYSSDMFKDDYLALWLVAIEEYYGIS